MSEFLDGLDRAQTPLEPTDRLLAVLGPKMLQLAGDRTAGTHPYLVTPEHTAAARGHSGRTSSSRPNRPSCLRPTPARPGSIARTHLSGYLVLPNYTNNWKRIGFSDDDLADGGSDHLVDAFVAWGDETAIRERVQAHRDAGADHVCVQALTTDRLSHAARSVASTRARTRIG